MTGSLSVLFSMGYPQPNSDLVQQVLGTTLRVSNRWKRSLSSPTMCGSIKPKETDHPGKMSDSESLFSVE